MTTVTMRSRKRTALMIVAVSVAFTMLTARQAYLLRGHWAIGGEWCILLMGLLAALIWWDETNSKGEGSSEK